MNDNDSSAERTPASYTRTAVSLHWLVASLVITAFVMGWIMTDMAFSPDKLKMYNWHKWVGITILGLVLIRLAWRLFNAPPAPVAMPQWQHRASQATHVLLYVLMLAIPLSGWIGSNAAGYPIVYLGRIPLPNLVTKDKGLAELFEEIHEILGWLLIALLVLHVAAAFKHHFVDRDDTLRRMLPWRRR